MWQNGLRRISGVGAHEVVKLVGSHHWLWPFFYREPRHVKKTWLAWLLKISKAYNSSNILFSEGKLYVRGAQYFSNSFGGMKGATEGLLFSITDLLISLHHSRLFILGSEIA